jgi:apolipoprotein N-acyltransferase
VRQIRKSAWLLVVLSAALQVAIFPLPNLYFLAWFAITPLLVALLRTRPPQTLQLTEGAKLLPASPWQGFLLGYVCGILWFCGTCYWIYSTMHQWGGLSVLTALGALLLFSLYLGLYFAVFGLVIALLAAKSPFRNLPGLTWAVLLAPAVWVGLELARTDISGFPWNLLGTTQVDNIPLARIATATGVYGLSFEIMVVNAAMAAAFLVKRQKRRTLLVASIAAAVVLQSGSLVKPHALPGDHTAVLVQANVPVLENADWTPEYFQTTLRELSALSINPPGHEEQKPDLIVWPESPAPFYTNDPNFQRATGDLARQAQAWTLIGTVGVANQRPGAAEQIYNSAVLVSPNGEWLSRYDKVHLVPFGEYVPFKKLFAFASGLTEQVGQFTPGRSRAPLEADDVKLGVFICYESIFPDEVRQFASKGAQVFINLSNDGWYGDSGAYAQHLKQSRMRAVENERWLLLDTNTGVTASVDPFGRIVVGAPRKVRTALLAPYALSNITTFYTRHRDWFAFACAIICVVALGMRIAFRRGINTNHGRRT